VKLVAALLSVAEVNAGMAESNGSLLPFMTHLTCRLTAKNRDPAPEPYARQSSMGLLLPFYLFTYLPMSILHIPVDFRIALDNVPLQVGGQIFLVSARIKPGFLLCTVLGTRPTRRLHHNVPVLSLQSTCSKKNNEIKLICIC